MTASTQPMKQETSMQSSSARDYINSLRNPLKRQYAVRYLDYLTNIAPTGGNEPDHGKLGSMAAQAVRFELSARFLIDSFK